MNKVTNLYKTGYLKPKKPLFEKIKGKSRQNDVKPNA